MDYIYLDNNAFPVPRIDVIEKLNELGLFALPLNASSTHLLGQKAHALIEDARFSLLNYFTGFGCNSYDAIFTSSATEANSLIVNSLGLNFDIVCYSAGDHKSVVAHIQSLGHHQTIVINIDNNGSIDEYSLYNFLRLHLDKKIFLSIIYVNNETGVINDIKKLVQNIRAIHNSIIIHSDFSMAVGKVSDINIVDLCLDAITISGYKFGALIGSGALIYDKKTISIKPMILGGGQEGKLRAGTENCIAIYSMKLCLNGLREHYLTHELRDYFESELMRITNDNVIIFGSGANRVGNTCYFSISNMSAKMIIMYLGQFRIIVGSGAACSAGIDEISHVLKAMGIRDDIIDGAVRISLSSKNTKIEIDFLISKLSILYTKLQ